MTRYLNKKSREENKNQNGGVSEIPALGKLREEEPSSR